MDRYCEPLSEWWVRLPSSHGLRSYSACSSASSTNSVFRLGEKRAGQLQNLVGLAQLTHLALEVLHALRLASRHAFSHAGIDLGALDPFVQGLRHAANLESDGLDGRSQRRVFPTVLPNHPPRTLTDLGRELVRFARGSILSEC